MNRRGEWAAITLILLLAAVLRTWMLGEVPPGLFQDEVINWQIAQHIRAGQHAIYFSTGYGREALYHYGLAVTVGLFGDHWLGLRYASVAFGLLGLATTYVLIRRLFGRCVALLTASWLAISFWPLFYARTTLRAISLPFIATLCAYFLIRAVGIPYRESSTESVRQSTPSGLIDWSLAGIFLGLSLYAYMASRFLPIIVAIFLLYLLLVRRWPPIPFRGLLALIFPAAIVATPFVVWLVAHPGAEYRISEVREPLDRLLAGDASLVWQNLVANLKMFTFSGDPWAHQNYLRRPVYADAISAALFYAGVLIAAWRWRDARYGFVLIWLFGALVPSVVTSTAPNSARDILGLMVVFVFPALGLVQVGRWIGQRLQPKLASRRDRLLTPQIWRFLAPTLGFLVLVPCFLLTVRDYFDRWRYEEVARFFYQADLTAVAHRLDEMPPGTSIVVAGLSVHSLDRPSLYLTARRDVTDLRLCDTRETLVLPNGRDVRLFVPQVVPFDIDLQKRLLEWGATVDADSQTSFDMYRLSDDAALRRGLRHLENTVALPDGAPGTLPISVGGRLAFLGYEWLEQMPVPGGSLNLLTYWRVEEPRSEPLKIFVHLIGESGIPLAQHDGLGSPPEGWASGDLVVQKHVIPLSSDLPAGKYAVQVGVYEATTNTRLPMLTADRLMLDSVRIWTE